MSTLPALVVGPTLHKGDILRLFLECRSRGGGNSKWHTFCPAQTSTARADMRDLNKKKSLNSYWRVVDEYGKVIYE